MSLGSDLSNNNGKISSIRAIWEGRICKGTLYRHANKADGILNRNMHVNTVHNRPTY